MRYFKSSTQQLPTLITSRFELFCWCLALVLLYFMNPSSDHFSLCPLSAIGAEWCPGCGIGHSIHYYLHLDFKRGWEEHYFGIFAVLILLYRIFQLLFNRKHLVLNPLLFLRNKTKSNRNE